MIWEKKIKLTTKLNKPIVEQVAEINSKIDKTLSKLKQEMSTREILCFLANIKCTDKEVVCTYIFSDGDQVEQIQK